MAISTTDTTQGTTNDFEARLKRIEAYLGFTMAAPVDPAARQAEMKAAADAAATEEAQQKASAAARQTAQATHLDDAEHKADAQINAQRKANIAGADAAQHGTKTGKS